MSSSNPISSKFLILTLILSVSVGAYFLISDQETDKEKEHSSAYSSQQEENTSTQLYKTTLSPVLPSHTNNIAADLSDLRLLAVVVTKPMRDSTALIQTGNSKSTYNIDDTVAGSDAILSEVFNNYVILKIDGVEHSLFLVGGEEAGIKHSNQHMLGKEEPFKNKGKGLAREIGNRPKALEHIIHIAPTNNGVGPFVLPGINPSLYRSAGFKEGDILQTINGKDVNIPEQLEEAKKLIPVAQTLEFTVLRNGKTITLYLDIPTKELSLSN